MIDHHSSSLSGEPSGSTLSDHDRRPQPMDPGQPYFTPCLYEQAFFRATEAIVFTDPHANIMAANPAFDRMFGFGAAEAVGKRVSECFPTEWRSDKWMAILCSTQEGTAGLGKWLVSAVMGLHFLAGFRAVRFTIPLGVVSASCWSPAIFQNGNRWRPVFRPMKGATDRLSKPRGKAYG